MRKEEALETAFIDMSSEFYVNHRKICRDITSVFNNEIMHFKQLLLAFNDEYGCLEPEQVDAQVQKVKEIFIEKEGAEMKISEIPVNIAMKYAEDKKVVIDKLKRQQRDIDASFKEVLASLKEERKDNEDEGKSASLDRQVANFQFALGIKNTVLNTQIAIVRKACNEYTKVIRKAL